MYRKLIIILAFFALLFATIGFFATGPGPANQKIISPIAAVPASAGLVVEIPDPSATFRLLRTKNRFWESLRQMKQFGHIDTHMGVLDSLLRHDEDIKQMTALRSLIISGHPSGKQNVEFLFAMKMSDRVWTGKVKEKIAAILGNRGTLSERKYSQYVFFQVNPANGADFSTFWFALYKHHFVLTFSDLFMQDVLRHLDADAKHSLAADPAFSVFHAMKGRDHNPRIYINLQNAGDLFQDIAGEKLGSLKRRFTDFAWWVCLEAEITRENVNLRGEILNNRHDMGYTGIVSQLEPVEMDIYNIFPSNTSLFMVVGTEDFDDFRASYDLYSKGRGDYPLLQSQLEEYQKEYGVNYAEIFYSVVEGQVAVVYTKTGSQSQERYVVARIEGGKTIRSRFETIASAYYNRHPEAETGARQVIEIGGSDYEVWRMPIPDFTDRLLGDYFAVATTQYFTFFDNYLVISSSPQALADFIMQNRNGNTLSGNKLFAKHRQYIAKESSLLLYADIGLSAVFFSRWISADWQRKLTKNQAEMEQLGPLCVSMKKNGKRIACHGFIRPASNRVTEGIPNWIAHTDTLVNQKAWPLKNHYTNESEFLVQDAANALYLISTSGKIRWKKKLPAPILGDVHQIDRYDNGKLQFIFNTKDAVYVIDRNGEITEGYPLVLPSAATCGLSVFDYDNIRKYRILIPCADLSLRCYDQDAHEVEGWTFGKTKSMVLTPVKHFKSNTKDYLVFTDLHSVYLLDRRGEVRVPFDEAVTRAPASQISYDPAFDGIVFTDLQGLVYRLGFDGKLKKVNFGEFSPTHSFVCEDIDCDGKKEYLFLDGKNLWAYSGSRSLIYRREFDDTMSPGLTIYNFARNRRNLGMYSASSRKAYLLDQHGAVSNGFPIETASMFSVHSYTDPDGNIRFNYLFSHPPNMIYSFKLEQQSSK